MSKPRSTKAEQFNAKIHGLREIYKRLDSKTLPLPTGNDVANYVQWFQDVLQGLVKEERPSLTEDKQRFDIQKYPAMAYVDLYKALIKMVKVVPNCELGSEAFAKNILSIIASLIPFLPKEHLDSLPLTVAMFLAVWPETVHTYIFNLLCGYIMPVVLYILKPPEEDLSYAVLSCPSLVMTVLQYCPDSKQQAQFVETLMLYKTDVCLDLLAVVAYGPQPILNSAGQILLHFYPLGLSGGADDWQFMYESWYPEKCQNLSCMVPNHNNCVKICFDASYAASKCDLAPPVFICAKCSELASREIDNFNHFFLDLLDPLGPVPTKCQGETCKGQGVSSAMMCFSPECAKRNKNRGTAMCMECNDRYHSEGEGAKHTVQSLFPDPWSMKGCEQAYITEAVVRLLREAQPCQATRYVEMGLEKDKLLLEQGEEEVDNDINNRRMLSRFGIWLLVGICGDPTKCESPERLGRLVAMVIEWIDVTSSLMKDYVGELLKRLATQHASKWLATVRDTKMELFCACLSPTPPEYAKVGGCWDSLTSPVQQLIEGLHRVCCLIPFQLANVEVWDLIMPLWMDAIKTTVPQEELFKFGFLLRKLFDPYKSPYKLPSELSLGFVKKVLEESLAYSEQVQALTWLQMLSTLEVVIKLHMLTSMFIKAIQNQIESGDGIATMFPFPSQDDMPLDKRDAMHSIKSTSTDIDPGTPGADSLAEPPQTADSTCSEKEAISNLSSFIIMLDLLVKQVQLQRQRENRFLNSVEREDIKKLIKLMLDVSWTGIHGDHSASCQHCEMVAVWFKLAFMLFEAVFTTDGYTEEDTSNAVAFGNLVRTGSSCSKAASFRSTGSRRSAQITETIDEEEVFDDAAETRSRQMSVNVEQSGSVTTDQRSEPDSSQGQGDQSDSNESAASFSGMRNVNASIGSWRSGTSSATWYAVYDNYPQLQLLIGLLKELPKQQDHIVQLNMLKCVRILVLRGDYLRIAMEAEPDFLAYLQEIFFVPNLWDMLRAEHSVLSEICVEILLHCICLPFGAEKLCDSVESAFTDDDWRVRFAGVEKFTVIARFLEIEKFKSNKVAMSALAQCFTYLVGAVEDVCTPVSTRTIAMLDTIKSSSLKNLYACIEHQYDAAPKDRLLLIHTCRILHRTLPHYTPLCGQFFIRRFKHLLIENADYVSYGSPKARSPAGGGGSAYISPVSEVATTPFDSEGSRKGERWRSHSSTKSGSRASRMQDTTTVNRLSKERATTFRCGYTFRVPGEKISYNRQLSNSSEGGNTSTGGRQRRTGGFPGPLGHSSEITDRMFLGGRIQIDNLSTVEEEADSERADNDSSRMSRASLESTHSQEPNQGAPQDSSDLEAAATHQLVTLVMDFLAYPGANKTCIPSKFVKTESYEVVQMSHYLGVLMGYDIKVGEFTGDPRRLRLFPVFHAYMSGIVQVLDQNQDWGGELINLTLQLLLFCAAPRSQRRTEQPEFTLIRLSQPMRRTWLMTILIILYKYPFYQDSHRRDTKNLITVVINTLEAQDHKCPGPRSAKNQRQSLSLLDLENLAQDDAVRPDTPGSPRHNKRAEACRASPTYKQRLSTCSSAIEVEKDDKNLDDDDQKNLPLMAIHETSFVGTDSSQQKVTTSTPLLEFSPGGSRGGSSSALTDEERNAERRPLIDGVPDKKRVSVDSNSSREMKESLEGVLSLGADDGRKTSRPKLLAGVSMRSMDHSLERSLDKFMDAPGDKEPELQDIDLDICPECGATLEEFDEETLNMAIVALSTYAHQSPSMAMPYLLRMLECVGRKCVHPMFPWEDKSDILIPGSSTEVSKQFLRCVLIKLAPNGIFSELFRTTFDDEILLKAIAYALNDYSAFDQMSPIAYLLEDILGFRTLSDRVMLLLSNLATYFKYASKETTSAWSSQLSHFENFFRKLPSALPENCDITPAFKIMSAILTAANSSFKELLHPFGQVLTFGINKASFQLQDLLDLCSKCNETFPKERDKLYLTRIVVQEMIQAVRFKSYLPDANLHSLLQVLAIDAGSRITFGGDRDNAEYSLPFGSRTRAMDCIQNYLIEIVEFIRDWHFTSRSSNENKRLSEPNLHFDTVPIHLKAGMSQLAALELAKQPKSSKLYTKSLTWLKNPPSAVQLGPKELQECVSNMRLLTWILQGSLAHVVNSKMAHASCQPISLEENVNIARYVLIVLHSFAEPLKDSLKITALYHAFHLCEPLQESIHISEKLLKQAKPLNFTDKEIISLEDIQGFKLWTLYCDITKLQGEYNEQSSPIVLEFWGIVTPGILNLLTKAKEMSELVGDNFLNLLEALQECNCTSLPKLYPMWHSILTFCFSLKKLSEGSSKKLRKAQTRKRSNKETRTVLAKWLKQLQFKIALAEQSAANGQTQFHSL